MGKETFICVRIQLGFSIPFKTARSKKGIRDTLGLFTRISHNLSTTEPQYRALTALHLVWVLNLLEVRFRAQNLACLVVTHSYEPSLREL